MKKIIIVIFLFFICMSQVNAAKVEKTYLYNYTNLSTSVKINLYKEESSEPDYKVDDSATLADTCSSPSFRKPMKFIGIILNFVKIIVPIIIIAFGVLDLYKAVTANKDDGLKKSIRSIAIRVIAGVFIFLLPGIIQFVLNMVNEWSDYKNVWCCCTDCILNPDCDVNSCSSETCHIEGTN